MIRQFILIIVISIICSCGNQHEKVEIKLLDCFTLSELINDKVDSNVDSLLSDKDFEGIYVFEIEVFNYQNEPLCFDIQNWLDTKFLNVSQIKAKNPMKSNLNNWSLSVLDTWPIKNDDCIASNSSKKFYTHIDRIDFSKDSLIIIFSSPSLEKGLEWKLNSLFCED